MSIPSTEPNDNDDVTLALETAEALWNNGDPNEALRWLRRAAEAAGNSGDDMRAVALAKAVADLNAAGPEQGEPNQVRPPPLPSQAAAPESSSAEAESSGLNAKGGLKGLSKAPPAPPSARKSAPPKPPSPPSARTSKAPEPEATETEPTGARAKSLNPPPTPPGKSAKKEAAATAVMTGNAPDQAGAAKSVGDASVDKPPASARLSAPPTKSVTPASQKPAAAKSIAPTPSKAPAASAKAATAASGRKRNFARAALRVYVTPKDQDGDRLEVHVLNSGELPPQGAVEAMLVPLRRGAKLIR